MDPNTYVLAAVLNGLRHKELGTLPPEAEFTPFNLSALRQTPKRPGRPPAAAVTHREQPAPAGKGA
jgi:hypothetical protein